jgi:hypothetical protein
MAVNFEKAKNLKQGLDKSSQIKTASLTLEI